jgi:protein involved in polysaccharide export with SLBB domain
VQLDQPQVDIYAGRVAGPLELMSFLPSGNAVPQSYQLASGDVLTVRIWSPTMAPEEMMETVSPTGTITLPGLGNFTVRGQTMDQAEHALRERVRRWYKGGDVSVTLRQQRSMLVTITGDAYLPGSYLVPASQTAYNVLYAAGGPTVDGSLRSIEVRRAGKLVGTLDIYDFLGVGGPSHDIPLQPGDVINIPSRYSSVAVSGEVRKPAIFELKPDENLRDALHFAGGIKASGVSQRVQVNTEDPGTARVLRDIDIHDAAEVAKTALYDGDEVDVFSVRNDVANRVTIEGAVEEQGDYALAPGMKVADLVSRARGVRYNAYTRRADLYRWNADNTLTLVPVDLDKALSGDPKDNIELTRWDRLKVYGRDELTWTAARQVRVRGAVQHEGIYYRSDGMHASDLLRMAGGPLPEAYLNRLILLHQHPDGSFTYDYVNATGWASGDPSSDPLIQNNDVLAVYREDEAHFTADHTVRIDGEVVAPGVYPRGDHMRVSDLVKLAGGFTPRAGLTVLIAHPNKMQAAKTVSLLTDTVSFDGDKVASGKDLELRDGDVVTVQGVGGFHSKVRLVYIDGRVNRPGPVPLTPNMRLSDLIKAAGGLMPDAFVEGAEFERDPALLGTQSQQNVAKLVGNLTDLLNNSDYQRDLALSDAERIQTIQDAAQPDNTSIPIPGLGGSTAAAAASVVSPTVAAQALKQQRELVSPARGMNDPELAPSGNLAVDVADALRHPGSASDVVLAEGDTVVIPTQPTTVEVAGAVFNTRGVVFKPGAGLDYYISESGGYAPDAARDRIEIIHPGGGLVPAYKVHRIEAGDMILVPTKVLAAKIQSHRSTLDDLFKTAVGASVVLRVLGL